MTTQFLSDEQWQHLLPILQGLRRQRRIYLGADAECRRFVEAVVWILRSGAPWRLLPSEYGAWNTIYKRYARWCEAGVWDGVLSTLTHEADLENVMLDSTIVKAHACATGATKKAVEPKAKASGGDATG